MPVHFLERKFMTPRNEVYAAIDTERDYQGRVWTESGANGNGVLSIGEQILLIEEYAAHARACWSKEAQPEIGALNIIRKIAGIAVHCMEDHGAPRRQ
jgi:hypothetical protein